LTHALDRLIKTGADTLTLKQDGMWKDVGTPDDIIESNRILTRSIETSVQGTVHPSAQLNGSVQLGHGSKIGSNAIITGPVVIGQDTVVEAGSAIGPHTSIGDDCIVSTPRLRSSVLFDGVEIDADRKFENMVLAANSCVDENQREFSSSILGENATVTY